MKCKDCNSKFCSYGKSDSEDDCFYESHPDYPMPRDLWNNDNTDWQALRNQAAIAAMQGALANCYLHSVSNSSSCSSIAKNAVLYADALIEALKKK